MTSSRDSSQLMWSMNQMASRQTAAILIPSKLQSPRRRLRPTHYWTLRTRHRRLWKLKHAAASSFVCGKKSPPRFCGACWMSARPLAMIRQAIARRWDRAEHLQDDSRVSGYLPGSATQHIPASTSFSRGLRSAESISLRADSAGVHLSVLATVCWHGAVECISCRTK